MLPITILIAQTLISWSLVLLLYKLKSRITLIPLYVVIAVSTLLTHNLADLGFMVSVGPWQFLIGSVTFFTTVMLGQLILYLFEGPRAARLSFVIIMSVSVLYVLVVASLGLQTNTSNWVTLTTATLRTYFWSMTAISVDIFAIAVIWEVLARIKKIPLYIRTFLVVFTVFLIDAIIFVTGVFAGQPSYSAILLGNIWTRLGLTLMATPAIVMYMKMRSYSESQRVGNTGMWEIFDFHSDLEHKIRSMEEVLKNERFLSQELKKFQLSVEAANDQIVITDHEGVAIYANPAMERLTGFSRQEAIGLKAGTLWGKLMDQEFYERMWRTIKTDKQTFIGQLTNHRKDGQKYEVLLKISPVISDSGDVKYFVAIERDITKEKQLDRMKDEFVSVASHELRTPMTAIKGFTSMILEGDYGPLPDKVKEPLQDIASSTERLIHLVNDMLNLSRIEAGRLKYQLTELDPATEITAVVKVLSPVAKARGLKLVTGDLAVAKIYTDQDKLSQVLNNLIGNALKFTEKGQVTISSVIRKDMYTIFVTDTGVGIAKENRDRIFGKFEQVKSVQAGRPDGTGLGLYISKQIALKLGGDVWIEKSTPNQGTTFGFSMPVADSVQANKMKQIIEKELEKV